MQDEIVYGVESIEIATIGANGVVHDDWTRIENIEEGSVSLTSNADQRTAITPEDKDAPIIFLYTPATEPDAYNFALLEISPDNLNRFFHIEYDETTSLVTVLSAKKRANLAIRLTTRSQLGVKKIFTYNNTICQPTYKNNITKNGLLAIAIVASILPWKTSSGKDAAYTVQKVLEDGTVIDSTPSSGVYDTELVFASSVTDFAEGVTGTVPAIDADLKFQFHRILDPEGAPTNMVLKLSTVTAATIDFPDDYLTKAFKFTDATGTVHSGVFTAGNVTLV